MKRKRTPLVTQSESAVKAHWDAIFASAGPGSAATTNRQLFEYLCEDEARAALYLYLRQYKQGTLRFPTRVHMQDDPAPSLREETEQQDYAHCYLLTDPKDVSAVLVNADDAFSNIAYRALGGGSFMLAIDDRGIHARQQQVGINVFPDPTKEASNQPAAQAAANASSYNTRALSDLFPKNPQQYQKIAPLAIEQAALTSLAKDQFDLAEFSEHVALRYCMILFGFAHTDYLILEDAMRKIYRALNYQMLARHFTSEPTTIPAARAAMALLQQRASVLIEEYKSLSIRKDEPPNHYYQNQFRHLYPDGVQPLQDLGLSGFTPVLKQMAIQGIDLNGEVLSSMVAGLLAGIVGNIQASVCIAVDALLGDSNANGDSTISTKAREVSVKRDDGTLWKLIAEALRINPPAAFLPRRTRKETKPIKLPSGVELPPDTDCILAIGGATMNTGRPKFEMERALKDNDVDPLVFGLEPSVNGKNPSVGLHWCIGAYLAKPLITQIVGHVLRLPSIERRLDPATAEPLWLEKRWGFGCERLPLVHASDKRRKQRPLIVIMNIKAPIQLNADRLRAVIRSGAPRIEQALKESNHVHFAWFEFIENDSKLVLHTIYDGDFSAYIDHFALKIDDMFDQLFQYIESAPPLPVGDYPEAFVETIRRFDAGPGVNYFFSAYPGSGTAEILRRARERQ